MTTHPKERKQRFSDNFYNKTTYVGVVLSLVILFCETILFWVDFLSSGSNGYLGILTYILLPPFLILGLILIPLGAKLKQARVKKGVDDAQPKAIHIDLSKREHQNAFIIFVIGSIIVMLMTAIGSYKAYNFTESDRFCGLTCHKIMEPEFKAHMNSAHSKVKCVECHIGSGANWYVHYKMAGVRMLLKTLQGSYATPIPAPVVSLRPAKEICQECHWPGKSFNAIQINKTYYADDPTKTPKWTMQMLIHVSGNSSDTAGIHAHMYNNNDIYYVADDEKRQKISWVKTVGKDGEAHIYTTKNSPYVSKMPEESKIRKMDCMDCHNRPAHNYKAPMVLINQALESNKISSTIPMIKGKAVDVLSKEYKNEKEAADQIESTLSTYYAKNQPEFYALHRVEVEEAIGAIIQIYKNNFFPEMKARWEAYPENIGHMVSNGCFRCHDDEHTTKSGAVISRNCTKCHTITRQGSGDTMQKNVDGLEFQHPFEDDGSWKTMNCADCHTGGS